MSNYIESATFRAIDEASRPIGIINRALRELERTQAKFGKNDPFAAMTKHVGGAHSAMERMIRDMRTATTEAGRMASALERLHRDEGRAPRGSAAAAARIASADEKRQLSAIERMERAELRATQRLAAAEERTRLAALERVRRGTEKLIADEEKARSRATRNAERENIRIQRQVEREAAHRGGSHGGFDFGKAAGRFSPSHIAMHITARTAYLTASTLEHGAVEGAKEGSNVREQMYQRGLSSTEIAERENASLALARKHRTTSIVDNMDMFNDVSAALHDFNDQKKLVDLFGQRQDLAVGRGEDAKQAKDGVVRYAKILEMTGKLIDSGGHFNAEATNQAMEMFQRTEQIEGRNLPVGQIQQAIKMAKTAGLTETLPNLQRMLFMGAEVGGSSAGTIFNSARQNLIGHATQPILHKYLEYGIGTGNIEKGKVVNYKLNEQDLLNTDADAWIKKYILPIMDKKHIQVKDYSAMATLMTEIFSNQRGGDFMEKWITQMAENRLKAEAAEKTRVDAGTAAGVGNRSLNAASVGVEKAYESFFTSAGKRLEPILLPLMNKLTDAINVAGDAAKPGASLLDQAKALGLVGAGGAGVYGASAVGTTIFNKLFNPLTHSAAALDGSALALSNAAAALSGAAGRQSLGSALGKVGAGGVGAGVIEGGGAALTTGGAVALGAEIFTAAATLAVAKWYQETHPEQFYAKGGGEAAYYRDHPEALVNKPIGHFERSGGGRGATVKWVEAEVGATLAAAFDSRAKGHFESERDPKNPRYSRRHWVEDKPSIASTITPIGYSHSPLLPASDAGRFGLRGPTSGAMGPFLPNPAGGAATALGITPIGLPKSGTGSVTSLSHIVSLLGQAPKSIESSIMAGANSFKVAVDDMPGKGEEFGSSAAAKLIGAAGDFGATVAGAISRAAANIHITASAPAAASNTGSPPAPE